MEDLIKEFSNFHAKERLFFHQLDINDPTSRDNLCSYLTKTFGTINILVNNIGVCLPEELKRFTQKIQSFEMTTKDLDHTMITNYYETVNLSEKLLPIISEKLICIGCSSTTTIDLGKDLKSRFENENITVDDINTLAQDFRKSVENATWEKDGWPNSYYIISKMCLCTYCSYLSKRKDIVERNIQVYCCCPGWVKTDLGSEDMSVPDKKGVVTPMYLIELENKFNLELQGKFISDCKIKNIFKQA